jgi:F0F1-type ATP synthase alpha subunit
MKWACRSTQVAACTQFTELQAFAQFASDLDASTQRLLLRGQVVLIYTGTRTDYLEQIPVTQVQDVKLQLLERRPGYQRLPVSGRNSNLAEPRRIRKAATLVPIQAG